MKMKLNEWRQLAGCYFFPTFSLLLNKPFCNKSTPGNQQIINIELEYKYFVSCCQRNFVGYCLSCDCGIINPPKNNNNNNNNKKAKQNKNLPLKIWSVVLLFGCLIYRHCLAYDIVIPLGPRGVKRIPTKHDFSYFWLGFICREKYRYFGIYRYFSGGKPVCGKVHYYIIRIPKLCKSVNRPCRLSFFFFFFFFN